MSAGDAIDGRQGVNSQPGRQPCALSLRPAHGRAREPWSLQLDEGILTLLTPDGRIVMMLPCEEAALHMRFDWDLLRGRTVSFWVVEGLKAHQFQCDRRQLAQLLAWLPQKDPQIVEREVRYYGVAMVLIGVAQLLFPRFYHWGWGLAFVFQGLLAVLLPRRAMFAINALLMMSGGLALLFWRLTSAPADGEMLQWTLFMRTGMGGLLLLWSVQQSALLGANHRLRVARRRRSVDDDEDWQPSPVVRKVSWMVGGLSLLLLCQVAGLFIQHWLGSESPQWRDWVLSLTLATLTLGALAVLRFRTHAAYLEARIAGQMTVVILITYLAGVLIAHTEGSLPFPVDILWLGLFALGSLYHWIAIIVFVLMFNRWFSRAVDREMEESGE